MRYQERFCNSFILFHFRNMISQFTFSPDIFLLCGDDHFPTGMSLHFFFSQSPIFALFKISFHSVACPLPHFQSFLTFLQEAMQRKVCPEPCEISLTRSPGGVWDVISRCIYMERNFILLISRACHRAFIWLVITHVTIDAT